MQLAVPQKCATTSGFQASGINRVIDVPKLLKYGLYRDSQLAGLREYLNAGLAVAVRLDRLGGQAAACDALIAACHCLATAAIGTGRQVEVTLRARDIEPGFAFDVVRRALPNTRLNLIVDEPADDALRRALWQLRAQQQVLAASWPHVAPACALLNAERATDVLPSTGLLVPAETAWLECELELVDFVSNGRFDDQALIATLRALVDAGDLQSDEQRWPSPAMQADAWMNRRLAIRLSAIGDTAQALGLDPADAPCLTRLRRIVTLARDTLRRRSRELAYFSGEVPAIRAADPSLRMAPGEQRRDWARRWQAAATRRATRHRCLLALGPWALFPSGKADFRFINLVPLLALADVLSFRRDSSCAHWNFKEFNYFYARFEAMNGTVWRQSSVAEQL